MLLFDENLSPQLIRVLQSDFPNSTHIDSLGYRGAHDSFIWDYAKEHSLIIVSKDNDFRQRSFLFGHPPKVIWLSVGNAGTMRIADLLRNNTAVIRNFSEDQNTGLLVINLNNQ
jgi:predicted nuclease of predicted toxin-antitoxin system